MKIIADLQLHSKYSRAVSNKMNIQELYRWSQIKGIHLIATGDWTHPAWMREIKAKLDETGKGTLVLREDVLHRHPELDSGSHVSTPEFLLATEISSIYSQGGKTRRVHNLLWVPTLKVAEKIIAALLAKDCNLGSDGRPIVGLSSIELAELVFEIDETCMIIPAHAWTPWFAMYGSKSGFDSIDECWGPYADKIYAIETGLSSDPAMNWRIAELDSRSIVSFSDAHSGPKVGREATVFEVEELCYKNVREAITGSSKKNKIAYTLEFYPEEGKYHWDGHRKCDHRQSPETTRKKGVVCPVCKRAMTVGVEYRIDAVASREPLVPIEKFDECGVRWMYHPVDTRPPYTNIIPLSEIISDTVSVGVKSKKVQGIYFDMIKRLGDEFTILLKTPIDEINKVAGVRIGEAVKRVRSGNVHIDPGYDGVFGTVNIWGDEEEAAKQVKLF